MGTELTNDRAVLLQEIWLETLLSLCASLEAVVCSETCQMRRALLLSHDNHKLLLSKLMSKSLR